MCHNVDVIAPRFWNPATPGLALVRLVPKPDSFSSELGKFTYEKLSVIVSQFLVVLGFPGDMHGHFMAFASMNRVAVM
jgi:hypothetical protein